jgi:polysaccharide biosynthesis transport protein
MELKRYFELIWRWAWLILLGAIVAGGAAFIISKNTTPVYRAQSRLLIDQAPGSSSGSANEYSQLLVAQRLAQTYVEIMKTQPVLEETINRLDLPFDPNRLMSRITISAPPDTQILVVSVEDTDPKRAALIADTLGEVFIENNQNRESMRYAELITDWQQRLNVIGDDIEALEVQINDLNNPVTSEEQARLSRLETQLNEAQLRYTEAFNNLNRLQLDQARESSNVVPIERAREPQIPIRPRTTTNTLLATIAGAMLAVGIVFLIEYLDDTVKDQDQVQEDTNLSTLGAIAQIRSDKPEEALITAVRPRDPISEAYRVLRTNLSFSAVDVGLSSVLVTSSSPSEGKSTTAANLAVVMAQAGKRVILVDADLRRPTQHKIFSLSNNQGLTTAILDNQTPINYHLQESKIKGLRIMSSGPIPPNPAELLNSQRMSHVLEELKNEADIVLFDSPPALTVTDAAILATQVDGSLLVVHVGETRRDTFMEAAERMHKTGSPIFGVVLNRLNPARSGYYYYQYYNTYESQQGRQRSGKGGRMKLPKWLPGASRR